MIDDLSRKQPEALERNCARQNLRLNKLGSAHHGIVHVIGPELGLAVSR